MATTTDHSSVTSPWADLVLRRPVTESARGSAEQLVTQAHRWTGRLTSSPSASVAFAVFVLAYLLTGVGALGILAVLSAVLFLLALTTWGGVHTWVRVGRPTRPDRIAVSAMAPEQEL
jgi:hypothetical protein